MRFHVLIESCIRLRGQACKRVASRDGFAGMSYRERGKGQEAGGVCLLGLAPVCSGIVSHIVIDALRVGDARSCQGDEEPICVLSRVRKLFQVGFADGGVRHV
jgi:hypothetical protein